MVLSSFKAREVLEVLRLAMAEQGIPDFIQSNNGPEFIELAVQAWLGQLGAKTMFLHPGSPWENPFIESFNGKLRDEALNQELTKSLWEAEVVLIEFVRIYSTHHPHSALGNLTPKEFAARNCRRNSLCFACRSRG